MADAYLRHRQVYSSISGELTLVAATDDTTLVTGKANFTIYVQRIMFLPTTTAAQTITFKDSNGTAKVIAATSASPTVNVPIVFDFGSRGIGLTEGKNFLMDVSAAGLAGTLTWEGYSKLTAVTNS